MPGPAISVTALEKYFPPALTGWRALLQPISRATEKALAGVSFTVKENEAVAVIGANGAGKSTLLRILATLIIPTRGQATVGGFDVERESAEARRMFGYHTGGDEGFYGRLSARENLGFFAAMNNLSRADARTQIARIAESMGIQNDLNRQVRTFSTGMMHRLGLARALLHRPAILLLDEPTRSLDPIAASEFRRLLKDDLVRSRGTTLLFASHTLSEVEEIADRVVLLDGGRVIACESPRELCASTRTATLEAAVSSLVGRKNTSAEATVNLAPVLRKVAAFFSRDFAIARGYRGALLLETLEALFGVATFYYLSRFVQSPELNSELPAGTNYFAFALVGFAFFDYLSVSMSAFDSSLEEARQNRTLEALLVTQTPLQVILAGSAVYPFVALAIRTCVYLAWGALLFGFRPHSANWLGAAVILAASILAFAGLGVLSASYSILFKRGNPAKWIVLGVSGLVGGMMYPISVLPAPLQLLARLIPVTYSLEGMRAALLAGAGWKELFPSIFALLVFAAVLIPLSFGVFAWALRRTKITGTLTHI